MTYNRLSCVERWGALVGGGHFGVATSVCSVRDSSAQTVGIALRHQPTTDGGARSSGNDDGLIGRTAMIGRL